MLITASVILENAPLVMFELVRDFDCHRDRTNRCNNVPENVFEQELFIGRVIDLRHFSFVAVQVDAMKIFDGEHF